MGPSRAPAVAGSFYPSDAQELQRLVRECFVSSPLGPQRNGVPSTCLVGGIVPHAGYIYSGPCAAHFYGLVERDTECVVLLGVNHHGMGARGALSPAEFWDTPLGKVAVERALEKDFQAKVEFLRFDDRAHIREHSIEVQIPFLQTVLRQFVVVPISLGRLVESECERLGGAVAEIYNAQTAAGKKTVLIASSDLNHYLSPEETERLDAMVIERVLALDPAGLLKTVAEKNISMCGVVPTAVLLFAANALSARSARLLKHCHSGDVVPMGEVVGYASVAVEL